jgi:hypothetical protein
MSSAQDDLRNLGARTRKRLPSRANRAADHGVADQAAGERIG